MKTSKGLTGKGGGVRQADQAPQGDGIWTAGEGEMHSYQGSGSSHSDQTDNNHSWGGGRGSRISRFENSIDEHYLDKRRCKMGGDPTGGRWPLPERGFLRSQNLGQRQAE